MGTQIDLNTFVGQVQQIAPLPAVAMKVVQMAQDENTSAGDIASVLATDQAMTAKLLRLANSAYFAAGREIVTVRDAIVLLGMMEIRRLVLTTALMGRFTGSEGGAFSVTAFWGHALAVGMVAEVMARYTRLAAPEEAFTAGILHDIGKLVMNQYLKEQFDAATALATARGIPLEYAERTIFGFNHAMVGTRLGEIWRLPASLCEAIALHHSRPRPDKGLPFVVAQANDLCRDHGLWCGFEETEPGAKLPDAGQTDDPLRAAVLSKLGGWEKVVERANSFLGSAGMAPRKPSPMREAAAAMPASAPGFNRPAPTPIRPVEGSTRPSTPTPTPLPAPLRPAAGEAGSPRRSGMFAPDRMPADRFPDRFARR